MKIDTAIILAGGIGERLKPLTEHTPKPLLLIKGIPIIEHAINNFKKYNITNIILSVGYKADKIKEYFGDGHKLGVHITYCVENNPLGTGGAIREAAKDITDTFIAINGDNLADFEWDKIIEFHKKHQASVTLVLYPVEDVTQFGIAELDKTKIIRFIEKPKVEDAPTNLNNAGGYVIEPHVLKMLPEGKSSMEKDCFLNNAGGYVIEPHVLKMLPEGKSSMEKDCFEKLCLEGVVYGYNHESQWYPTDDLNRYLKAEKEFNPHK